MKNNKPSKKEYSKGKSKIHYIPAEIILGMGHAFEMGAEKHGPYSFRDNPIDYTELIDSTMRHLLAFMNGEDNDPESGLPHLWHAGCNIGMLEWTRVNAPEKDDRPKKSLGRNIINSLQDGLKQVQLSNDFKEASRFIKDFDENEEDTEDKQFRKDLLDAYKFDNSEYVKLSKPKKKKKK